jgi:hypothetical protein
VSHGDAKLLHVDTQMNRPLHLALPRAYSADDRERWIAEAAYYRAIKRGFAPGFALEDWLAGEALIDFELSHSGI